MAGGNNSLGYLRQINEKMDRLLAIAERYVGIPVAVEVAAEPAAAAAAAPAAAAEAAPAAAAEAAPAAAAAAPAAAPAAAAAAPAAAAAAAEAAPAAAAAAPAAAKPRIPIVRTSAQGTARMLRRLLERGVEASERPKIEKQIRDLQPKIDAEIAAGIPLESEFQSQYDAAVLYLTRDLKPESRAKMERTRNELKAKLNAEKEHGIARGGTKRKRKGSKKTKSRRN